MNFYTVVLRQSSGYWVGLCLENGIVGQGDTQEDAVNKLKDAIASFEDVYESEENIYKSPISIDELQELKLITFTGLIFTLSQAGSLCHLT
jgi:predicted RNase H-like HicB family nuclease